MARTNIALGLALIILSFVVGLPLHGPVGVVINVVISLGMFIAGVALLANRNAHWRELRPKFTKRDWGTDR
jgi:hypothetical protein